MSNESYQGGGFVGIEITGIEELIEKLGALPDEVQDEAIEAVNKYMLSVLKLYPPYAHVPFKSAYGNWFSEKQRRYVMARIRDGSIQVPRSRTYGLQGSWTKSISGYTATIENSQSYAHWVQGDDQARMMSSIGWQTTKQFVSGKAAQVFHMFEMGVKRAIVMLGL